MAIEALDQSGRVSPDRFAEQRPDEMRWHDVATVWRQDAAAGHALWEQIKQSAAVELACGATGATAIEGHDSGPLARAQYLTIWQALADGLQPRNGLERLLIDGMAEAWVMHRQWLHKHATTESLDVMRVERDARQRDAWQPPRLDAAEAVDRAAVMADRFQRQFLRLMKTYRDQRRLLGNVVVAAGGQLNVAEQQVNVASGDGTTEE
jgi:hypothetical protein